MSVKQNIKGYGKALCHRCCDYYSCTSSIAFKDLKTLVTSPVFFLVATFCSSIWSYIFLRNLSALSGGRSGNVHFDLFFPHFSLVNLIFIFAIPAVTMKLISEERKNKTYDLLLTSPITATQIVVGKFFAAFKAALIIIAISFLYPLSASFFTDISWGPVLSSYLGLTLLTGAYVAVGLFSSSLTESVMLSVIMGVIFNIMLWFLGQGADFSNEETFTSIMEHLSLGQHFINFIKGTISVKSTVFFLSVITFFVFLTQRVVESSRWR